MPTKPTKFTLPLPRKPWADRKGTAHERGYGWQWQQLRLQILRGEPLCRLCKRLGRTTPATVVDHIVPKQEGGSDDTDNLQPLCDACHKAKTIEDAKRGRG